MKGLWHAGNGLVLAGTIVMAVGLCIIAFRVFGIPGYWVPVAVGATLITAGLVLRAGPWRA
jgi:hypothetical protein